MGIDLTQPVAVHVVGVGGAGMSAIASVLAAMGHRVSGTDLKESAVARAAPGPGRRPCTSATTPPTSATSTLVAVSTAIPATQPRGPGRAASGASRCCGGPRSSTAIAATRRTVAVSGTHGKTTTSSMLALVLVEAGLRPSFIVGGELNEIGGGAVWDGRRAGSSSRPTRATARSSSCGADAGRRHERRGRPPRLLRRPRRGRGGLRPVPRRRPGPERRVRRRPGRGPSRRAPRRRAPTAPTPAPTT